MTRTLSLLATALMLGAAVPGASAPAFAQDSQAVRDALNRAQSGAERRAVEDLINRLRGAGTPAPAAAAPAPGAAGATPAQAGATPAAPAQASTPAAAPATAPAGTPPATTVSAPGTVPPVAPTAATPPAATPPAGAPAAATAAPARPGTPAAAVPPRPGQPAVAAPAAPAAPRPGQAAAPTPAAATAPAAAPATTAPAATAAPALPRGGDIMAKAPEIAEKMGLPRADIEVYFDFNSAEISPQAMSTLTVMGQALSDPQLAGQRFIIGGHTDGKGRADYNLNLSRRRAEAVRKFVIEHYKIEPARLIARGYGKSRLKNATMPSADENRRVQIINWTPMTAAGRQR